MKFVEEHISKIPFCVSMAIVSELIEPIVIRLGFSTST